LEFSPRTATGPRWKVDATIVPRAQIASQMLAVARQGDVKPAL
jgi:hypothetical protein